jgi:multidrug efflux pump subunit AcrB
MVRTLNEYTSLDEIAETILFRWEGRQVRVKDVARVVQRAQRTAK